MPLPPLAGLWPEGGCSTRVRLLCAAVGAGWECMCGREVWDVWDCRFQCWKLCWEEGKGGECRTWMEPASSHTSL